MGKRASFLIYHGCMIAIKLLWEHLAMYYFENSPKALRTQIFFFVVLVLRSFKLRPYWIFKTGL